MKVTINLDGKNVCCVGPTLSDKELSLVRKRVESHRGFEELAAGLSALGHETRLKIFGILATASKVCVCDLAEILSITPSAVSQHLSKMKAGGLVEAQRKGQTIYYSLSDSRLNIILTCEWNQTESSRSKLIVTFII